MSDGSTINPVAFARFRQFLLEQESRGCSQSEVARRLNVPPQYLSDVKAERRTFTELFARRIDEEFGTDYLWLLGGNGSKASKRLGGLQSTSGHILSVPLYTHLIAGDPQLQTSWDGGKLDVAGAAAARAQTATLPYALRLSVDDAAGRLRKNDLILISQEVKKDAEVQVLRSNRLLFLGRLTRSGKWQPIEKPEKSVEKAEPIGHCLGIAWGRL